MKFIFYSPKYFERWDYRTPDKTGIGGSEISHIEMATRLADRGHEVVSYSPLPANSPERLSRKVKWKDLESADFTEPGLWILYRCPEVIDKLWSQRAWLVVQDVFYPELTEQRARRFEKILPLCQDHRELLKQELPSIPDSKFLISSNGVRKNLIDCLETGKERNPFRLFFASSPDRGLLPLLKIFKKTREFIPELELHAAYGFDNLDKLVRAHPHLGKLKKEILTLAEQPNVTFLGRLNQLQLIFEWQEASLWVHPTDFTETSCITSMEAMALGAYPITRPLWAIRDNVKFGTLIEGSPSTDPLVQSRYVGEIIRAVREGLPQREREPMMQWARQTFDWERVVSQWENELWLQ